MWSLLGSGLIGAGSVWIGLQKRRRLRGRVRALEQMQEGLALLCQELEWDAPPLPELMGRLRDHSRGTARDLFSECEQALKRLDTQSFSDAWEEILGRLEELGEDARHLQLLAGVLGRGDCAQQRRGAECCRAQILQALERARERERCLGRLCQLVSVSGGAFLIILLL